MDPLANPSPTLIPSTTAHQNSIVSTNFGGILHNMLEAAIICRPTHALSFCRRYLMDEKEKDPSKVSLLHSCHALPFLLAKPSAFRDNVSTIFCYYICKQSTSKTKTMGKRISSVFRLMRSDFFSPSIALESIVSKISGKDEDPNNKMSEKHTSSITCYFPTSLKANLVSSMFDSFLGFLQLTIACHCLTVWFNNVLSAVTIASGEDDKILSRLTSFIKKQTYSDVNIFWTSKMQESWSLLALDVIDKLSINPRTSTDTVIEVLLNEYFSICSKDFSL